MSCLFFFALWLQSNQSILVQETQSTKDIDLTCFKTFPIKTTTCLQVGPMSLDWPVDPFAIFDFSRSSLSPEVPSDEQQRSSSFHTFPLATGCSPSITADYTTYYRLGCMWPFPFRRPAVHYVEHQRSLWMCFLQTKEQRVQTQISQEAL